MNDNEVKKVLSELESTSKHLIDTINVFCKALMQIADSSDQANPIALKEVARKALAAEPTTADESNLINRLFPLSSEDIVHGPNDPGDENDNPKILGEDAEALWRDTVLHPEYKSPYEEEE